MKKKKVKVEIIRKERKQPSEKKQSIEELREIFSIENNSELLKREGKLMPLSSTYDNGVLVEIEEKAIKTYDAQTFPYYAFTACRNLGATKKDLAELFFVAPKTITNWMNTHPPFMIAVKRGKEYFDSKNVIASLMDICLGYEVVETTTSSKNGVTTKNRHIPPSITAIQYYLNNRCKDEFGEGNIKRYDPLPTIAGAEDDTVGIENKPEEVMEIMRIMIESGALDNVIKERREAVSS